MSTPVSNRAGRYSVRANSAQQRHLVGVYTVYVYSDSVEHYNQLIRLTADHADVAALIYNKFRDKSSANKFYAAIINLMLAGF